MDLIRPNLTHALERVRDLFARSIAVKLALLESDALTCLPAIAACCVISLINRGKLLFCGNGGSAADAQHLAAELLVRLRPDVDRGGIPALALALDSSTLTACSNDYGFETHYARLTHALGQPGDVLIAITTSGRSPNILAALEAAKRENMKTIGFLGAMESPAHSLCDHALSVPSQETGRIQEAHITAGHALVTLIEDMLSEYNALPLPISQLNPCRLNPITDPKIDDR